MSPKEAAAVATQARRAHVVTLVEQRQRYDFIEALLARDVPHSVLVERCRLRFNMSSPAVERVRARIIRTWAQTDAQLRDVRKAQARQRIHSIIARAVRNSDLKAALRGEELLARIDGLFESTRVRVEVDTDFNRQMSAADVVFRNLTPEQVAEILAEQRETDAAAKQWREHVQTTAAGSPSK